MAIWEGNRLGATITLDMISDRHKQMEEYFKNELFPDKTVDIKGESANGNG